MICSWIDLMRQGMALSKTEWLTRKGSSRAKTCFFFNEIRDVKKSSGFSH